MNITSVSSIPFFIDCSIKMHFHPAEKVEASDYEKAYPEVCDDGQATSNIPMGVRIAKIKFELELQRPGYSTADLREIYNHETPDEGLNTKTAIKKVVEDSARLLLKDFIQKEYPKLKENTHYIKTELTLCKEQCNFEGAIFYLVDLRNPNNE